MFRVFLEGDRRLEFLTYNEFSAWRLKAAEGYKPHYVCFVHIRCGEYVYCYQLRKTAVRVAEEGET